MASRNRIEIETVYRDKSSAGLLRTKKVIEDVGKGMQKTTATMTKNVAQVDGSLKTVNERITSTTKKFGKFAQEFEMGALSAMFFGMQIQRIFTRLATTSVDAFNKIIESSGYAGTALNQLTAYMTYLRFEIGRAINTALLPLLPIIISIINAVSLWIQKHPKLFTALIGFGALIGALLFLLGSFVLGLSGLVWAFDYLGIAAAGAGGAAGLGAFVAGLGTVLFWIAVVIVAIALLKWMYDNNILGLKDSTNAIIPQLEQQWLAFKDFLTGIFTLDLPLILGGFVKLAWSTFNNINLLAVNLIGGAIVSLLNMASKIPGGGSFGKAAGGVQSIIDSANQSNLESQALVFSSVDSAMGLMSTTSQNATISQEELNACMADGSTIAAENALVTGVQTEYLDGFDFSVQSVINSISGENGLNAGIVQTSTTMTDTLIPTMDANITKAYDTTTAVDGMTAAYNRLYEAMSKVSGAGSYSGLSGSVSKSSSGTSSNGKQFGGDIPETGMYLMHRGEKVQTPYQGGNSSNGGINITINGSVDETVYRKLLHEIKRYTSNANLGR